MKAHLAEVCRGLFFHGWWPFLTVKNLQQRTSAAAALACAPQGVVQPLRVSDLTDRVCTGLERGGIHASRQVLARRNENS
jgi:hypothetical protein